IEQMVRYLSKSDGLKFVILRYFNVAGADPEGILGEDHEPETHLIPNVLFHLLKKRKNVIVNGNDYDTEDGTCIRDYIHVNDLVKVHILA
ncbi:NAD-dependent epimerase/dehydratase family protein, partial [Pseudomonas sp. 2995-1]|uniref:NAD-dependent epimerase/dehydratase family protein n=1 Tax=Pseudomonas sp. 2995-1 TaxID=1712679 RepID=UPI001179CE42